MARGFGPKCSKILLIIFNVVFWIAGAGMLALGIYIVVAKEKQVYLDLLDLTSNDPLLKYGAYLLIGSGCFIILVGFLGCCGAVQENKCMLGMYFLLLLVILAAQITIGVLAAVYRSEIKAKVNTKMRENIARLYGADDGKNTLSKSMDYLHVLATCCGIYGPGDFKNTPWAAANPSWKHPQTCCVMQKRDIDDFVIADIPKCRAQTPGYYYSKGCWESIKSWVNNQSIILISVGLGIAFLEIFGMILSICLCRNVNYD
ncbi:unnamed protein product [Gordionus sp. m RMFG-2023]|uniref:CD9 antigen-like n=1 Tax=Gordionus sp. m RMFG-2023 TaxID=3053472 RepID=UPI0030E328AA